MALHYKSIMKGFVICSVNIMVAVALPIDHSDEVVSSDCLQCLCEGPSLCDLDLSCDNRGGYFCGPFKISWAYWADAGRPKTADVDPNSKGGFVSCAKDIYCAAKTVRQYMKNFAKMPTGDCNGDGTIDCEDFAKMHRLGGYNCNQTDLGAPYFYENFNNCWSAVKIRQGKDVD